MAKKKDIFYVLIVDKDFDSIEGDVSRYSNRSRAYDSRKEAEEKAAEYIQMGSSKAYHVMECVGLVSKKPVDVVTTRYRK